jgi:hypothetical protein
MKPRLILLFGLIIAKDCRVLALMQVLLKLIPNNNEKKLMRHEKHEYFCTHRAISTIGKGSSESKTGRIARSNAVGRVGISIAFRDCMRS